MNSPSPTGRRGSASRTNQVKKAVNEKKMFSLHTTSNALTSGGLNDTMRSRWYINGVPECFYGTEFR